jgi:hypothetical protein
MSSETFYRIFYLQTTLSAVVAGFCFYRFFERSKNVRLIGLLFLAGFAANLIVFFTYSNLPSTIYDFILIVIAGIVYNGETKGRYSRTIFWATVFFILFGFSNLLFVQKEFFTSYNKMLSSFIIISYAVMYFYRLMVDLPTIHVQRLPMFWFNSAFLIYHAGTVFLFAFTQYLVDVLKDNLITYWSFHNVLSVLQHLIILIGLGYDLRKRSSPDRAQPL